MSIYRLMDKDWPTYCLMSSLAYIEEMSKPVEHIQIKRYKDKEYKCLCFRSVRLKMNDEEMINKFFTITKNWEKRKKIKLIGKTFDKPRKEDFSNQDMFLFTPLWLNQILTECGKIPNKYSFETAIKRINHLKQYGKIPINSNKSMLSLLLKDKKLAAGAFIISMDLEFRGIQNGQPSLCMSKKYKDFLQFMLTLAKKWEWTNNHTLSPVKVDYSRKLGINASPQYEFRIHKKGLQEIYELAGPLTNSDKDKCIKFNIERSKKYKNLGSKLRKNNTKDKILKAVKENKDMASTKLQFIAGVGVDVILYHLHDLEKKGKIKKERSGKRYIWNIK